MISWDLTPPDPLKEYIKQFRLRHFLIDENIHFSYKPFPPRPEQNIVFYPRGFEEIEYSGSSIKIKRSRSVISGQFTQRINRYLNCKEFLMIEVNLQPGALHRLTGVPFKEFTNQDLDAESFFPADIRYINERLSSAESYKEMISIIEDFFFTLIARQKTRMIAVDELLVRVTSDPNNHTVDSLTKDVFLSQRQMERKFDERIGISPRTFLRLCRFNQSYWMHLKNPGLDWFSIAIHCGYSDYQHMVKDYKDFADSTPSKLFAEEKQAPGRVLGLTK